MKSVFAIHRFWLPQMSISPLWVWIFCLFWIRMPIVYPLRFIYHIYFFSFSFAVFCKLVFFHRQYDIINIFFSATIQCCFCFASYFYSCLYFKHLYLLRMWLQCSLIDLRHIHCVTIAKKSNSFLIKESPKIRASAFKHQYRTMCFWYLIRVRRITNTVISGNL